MQIRVILDLFRNVPYGDHGEVVALPLFKAYVELANMFDLFGRAFSFAKSDVVTKCDVSEWVCVAIIAKNANVVGYVTTCVLPCCFVYVRCDDVRLRCLAIILVSCWGRYTRVIHRW